MFMTAGRIAERHGTKDMDRIRGVGESQPATAGLFFVGALALAGLPLTSVFLSELQILRAGFAQGRWVGAGILILGLATVFGGLVARATRMVLGPRRGHIERKGDPWDSLVPPALLLLLVLVLGVWMPRPLAAAIEATARLFRT
jgi:hydrogenase-4 component F